MAKKSGAAIKFSRNTNGVSTGSSIGKIGLKNAVAGKNGGKKRLGNPSSSMTKTSRAKPI